MGGRSSALGLGCVLLVVMTTGSCGPAEVQVQEVGRADVVELVDLPATVTARAMTTLTAAADGTLAELAVSSGDPVAAGAVLAVVDSPAARRRLELAEQALRAASRATGEAAPVAATGELAATQDAVDGAAGEAFGQARSVAGQVADPLLRETMLAQVDAAEQRYAAAAASAREALRAVEAGVASMTSAVAALRVAQQSQAQQAYELARATVEALTVRAPFAGLVQLGGGPAGDPPGWLATGAPVTAGAPLVTVVDVSELHAVAEVDEVDVIRVQPGVRGELELAAVPGARYPATVTALDPLPGPGERVRYRLRLVLGPGIRPDRTAAPPPRAGMTGTVRLTLAEARGAVVVPVGAVMRVDGVETVWVVRRGRAERVPVSIGVRGSALVQVLTGIEAGDRVVVRGSREVRTGQRLPS